MQFGEILRKLREEKGVSQRQIAKDLGLSLIGYQRYEYHQSKPNFDALIALADYFGVSLDYLVGREPGEGVAERG